MHLAYLVHDLADPAVARRVRMLQEGGAASILLAGFRRRAAPVTEVAGLAPVDLGRTRDGRFGQRMLALAGAALRHRRIAPLLAGTEVILARQLEMLALGALLRRWHAPGAGLAYECLDIHRLLSGRAPAGPLLRAAEAALLPDCGLLLTSSPAFLRQHFARHHRLLPPVHLVENKVLEEEVPAVRPPRPAAGPPWRIGWFGVIRCARSLALLADLCIRLPGQVEVVIRGRPARDALPDFDACVARTPGLRFAGPYDRARDLPRLYGEVHLAWAVDFFEAGGNSDWLLPNRLYEGSLFGAVPIARAGTETARWLARRGAGLLLEDPLERTLVERLAALRPADYVTATAAVAALPPHDLVAGPAECRALVAALDGACRLAACRPGRDRLPPRRRSA